MHSQSQILFRPLSPHLWRSGFIKSYIQQEKIVLYQRKIIDHLNQQLLKSTVYGETKVIKCQTPDAEPMAHESVMLMDTKQNCSRWVCCPICGGKTRTKVYEKTVLVKFPLYCPKCKKEICIDVVQFKMVISK